MAKKKRNDQPADDHNPFAELFNGVQSALDDGSRAIARDTAQTVWLLFEEYQRAGFTRAEAFELVRTALSMPQPSDPELFHD